MARPTRAATRAELAALLSAALVGEGLPAAAVYDHDKGDFSTLSPVVTIASLSSERLRETASSLPTVYYTFDLDVWVAAQSDGSWDESAAEDLIDDIEERIAQVIESRKVHLPYWTDAQYTDPSLVENWLISGQPYTHEIIRVRLKAIRE